MQFIFGLVLMIVWIRALAQHDFKDGDCVPSKDECGSCPFPCDKRKK